MNTRWPPGDRASSERRGAFTGRKFDNDQAPSVVDAIGDLSKLLRALSPAVLGAGTYQFTATGQVGEQYRVPFAAVAIASNSQAQLILTADTAKQSGPSSGPGVAIVPPRGFIVANMTGNAWTVYGGNPGDQVTITAFTRPLPPFMVQGSEYNASDYPAGAIAVDGDSGVVGAATATATLPGVAGKTTYLTGFEVTAGGATAAALVTVTVAGITTPKHYVFGAVAGAAAISPPLVVEYIKPIPASAPNTLITVSMPTLGAGNAAAAISAHGYQL